MMNTQSNSSAADFLRARRVSAVMLLLLAVLSWPGVHLPFAWREGMLLILGFGFIVWAALGRLSGLLVPGCLLLALGLGQVLHLRHNEVSSLCLLAGGFLLIPVAQVGLFRRWSAWPFYPAAGLLAAALLKVARPEWREWVQTMNVVCPCLLVVAAIGLWFSRPRTPACGPTEK